MGHAQAIDCPRTAHSGHVQVDQSQVNVGVRVEYLLKRNGIPGLDKVNGRVELRRVRRAVPTGSARDRQPAESSSRSACIGHLAHLPCEVRQHGTELGRRNRLVQKRVTRAFAARIVSGRVSPVIKIPEKRRCGQVRQLSQQVDSTQDIRQPQITQDEYRLAGPLAESAACAPGGIADEGHFASQLAQQRLASGKNERIIVYDQDRGQLVSPGRASAESLPGGPHEPSELACANAQ
jgi:hypothetical protein